MCICFYLGTAQTYFLPLPRVRWAILKSEIKDLFYLTLLYVWVGVTEKKPLPFLFYLSNVMYIIKKACSMSSSTFFTIAYTKSNLVSGFITEIVNLKPCRIKPYPILYIIRFLLKLQCIDALGPN